jgi:hypothetical protein
MLVRLLPLATAVSLAACGGSPFVAEELRAAIDAGVPDGPSEGHAGGDDAATDTAVFPEAGPASDANAGPDVAQLDAGAGGDGDSGLPGFGQHCTALGPTACGTATFVGMLDAAAVIPLDCTCNSPGCNADAAAYFCAFGCNVTLNFLGEGAEACTALGGSCYGGDQGLCVPADE